MSTTAGPARIMAHMVPYYPDLETSKAVAAGLIDGGIAYLEVQFPFSDPSADGPVIQTACTAALEAGFTVAAGFRFLEELDRAYQVPVFLMTYASIPVSYGMKRFVGDAARVGVRGIIAPDLPPDYDEGLYRIAGDAGIAVVPVVAPNVGEERLDLIGSLHPAYIYAALRRGITGAETEIGEENLRFIDRLKPIGSRILAGFGVRSSRQVEALRGHVDAVIVGSRLVKVISEVSSSGREAVQEAVRRTVEDLAGRSDISVS